MGIIVNETAARETPCKCYQLGKTTEAHDLLCFSKGIVGGLTDEQESKYCTSKDILPPTPELKKRISDFTEAVQAASRRYKGQGILTWNRFVSEEARKRGVEI